MGKKSWFIIGFNAIALAIIDQFSKWLAGVYLTYPVVLTDWFTLRYGENTGIAWSIAIPSAILLPLNIVLFVIIIALAGKHLDMRRRESRIFLTLIVGGALGNIVDRFARGYVVDFISVGSWPVFNLADMFLSIGIFLTVLFYAKIKRV